MIRLQSIAVCLLVAIAGVANAQDRYQPKVGELHPEIVLPNIENQESVALSSFRGKKVLLIHFASW